MNGTGLPDSGARVDDRWGRHSLRWRLPLLIGSLFLAALIAVVAAAYREVETTLERGAGERAEQAAQQIARIFAPSTAQIVGQLQQVAPLLRDYLDEPAAPGRRDEVRDLLTPMAPAPTRRVTVWTAAGARLFELPEAPPGRGATATAPPPERRPDEGISAIRAEGERAFADYAVAVSGDDGEPVGWVSVRSVLSVTPPDALSRLIGGEARILFGNADGSLWTDMTRTVDGPVVALAQRTFQVFRNAAGIERIGALSDLPGTPWLIWVGFPRADSVATAHAFLWRMIAIVVLVAVGAILLGQRLVAGVTTPLIAMTTAAEAMAAGDYSRRVATDRVDEIGRLGRAFNAMSSDVARELTERTRANERLLEREAQLSLYAEHSPVAVAMFDRNMRYLVASRRWVEDYQLGSDSVVGRCHYDVVPGEPERQREVHRRCLAGAVERCDEDPIVRPDGSTRWVRWEIRPWQQADGSIGGVIVFTEDISARKEAQSALRASEGRYRTLFDYAPDGIIIGDAARHYIDANPSMCRLLGRPREEILGLSAVDIMAPFEHSHIQPAIDEIAGGAAHHREWNVVRGDGSVFAADVISTEMPDGNVMAMFRDITDRNRAVEAVRAAEERMRFALQSAGVGIWDIDFLTGAVRWSDVLEAQYGLPQGSFGGSLDGFFDRIHPDDRAAARATITQAAGTDFSLQYRIVRPDGAVRWVNGAGQIYLDSAGRPARGVGISLDVTERHILEARFQQAQKMEAVGRLAGGVAHDFNNLLTAILGYCGLLLEDLRAEDPIRHDVVEIQKAGVRAAELTRQLLAFSRKQIIEPTLLDMNDVVGGLRSLLSRLISEDVEIVTVLGTAPMLITADRGQVEQIILNLAVNARDAMPTGGRLTIETAHVDLDEDYAALHLGVTPGAYVALTMTDTGTGMTPEVQSHLFEPFFTTKEPGKGTGLGLATVHGVVARSGGSVGVYSELGKGTSFKVYFPQVAATPFSLEEPRGPASVMRGDGYTVLVVDDAQALRELMQKTLQRQGYTVLLAANAAEALRLFEAHQHIDVLLTDVVMPGASGPELTADLLALRPELKVIYMSGYTEDAIVHHGVLKSGIAFLHKPFTAGALGHKIREVLGW